MSAANVDTVAERRTPPQPAAATGAPAPAPAPDETRHIGSVDSLRAVAMTAVIAEHCRVFPPGWTGVWLFFVISGFVVTTSLMSRPRTSPGAELRHFYVRRAARILPIYWGYAVVAFLVSGLLRGGAFEWPNLASLLLFYNNFQAAFAVGDFRAFPAGHLWTISVEMQFYLLYGAAFVLLPRRVLIGFLVALLLIAPALRFVAGAWMTQAGMPPLRASFAVYAFSAMHFDSFAAGALLALSGAAGRRRGVARALLAAGVLAVAAYALAYVSVNWRQGAHGVDLLRNVLSGVPFADGRRVWLYSAIALFATGVVASTAAGAAPWDRLTRSPVLQAIGRVSYGGYVYHIACVVAASFVVARLLPGRGSLAATLEAGGLRLALTLGLTLACAFLSYRFIESPILRASRRRRAPAAAA